MRESYATPRRDPAAYREMFRTFSADALPSDTYSDRQLGT